MDLHVLLTLTSCSNPVAAHSLTGRQQKAQTNNLQMYGQPSPGAKQSQATIHTAQPVHTTKSALDVVCPQQSSKSHPVKLSGFKKPQTDCNTDCTPQFASMWHRHFTSDQKSPWCCHCCCAATAAAAAAQHALLQSSKGWPSTYTSCVRICKWQAAVALQQTACGCFCRMACSQLQLHHWPLIGTTDTCCLSAQLDASAAVAAAHW